MANRFEGTTSYVLDDKSRLAVPPPYRKEFGDQEVILVKGIDPCVLLLNEDTYGLAQDVVLGQLSLNTAGGRNARRTFMASVARVSRDAQFRFALPASLATYAGLNKGDDVAIIGSGEWLEIWSAERWAGMEAEGMETLRDELEKSPPARNPDGGVRW
jgi:division/cell wall cluster transcriptional repressor MraZ